MHSSQLFLVRCSLTFSPKFTWYLSHLLCVCFRSRACGGFVGDGFFASFSFFQSTPPPPSPLGAQNMLQFVTEQSFSFFFLAQMLVNYMILGSIDGLLLAKYSR